MLKEKAPKLFEYLQKELIKLKNSNRANVLDSTIDRIELSLYDEYSEILKEKGVTEEQFNEMIKEFSEEQIMEYINKCK